MDESNSLCLMLGRLEGKVDALLVNHGRIESRLDSHAMRLQELEESKARATGALSGYVTAGRIGWAACAALLTYVASHLGSFLPR